MLDRYLTKRPRSRHFQLRVPVPTDVQSLIGKKEHTKSLGTEDRVVAAARAIQQLAKWQAEWEAARRILTSKPSKPMTPTPLDLQRLINQAYEDSLDIVDKKRVASFAKDPSVYEGILQHNEKAVVKLSRQLRAGNVQEWSVVAGRLITRAGFVYDQKSDWFDLFVRDVAETTISAIDVSNRRDRGELNAKAASDVVLQAISTVGAAVAGEVSNIAFDDLVAQYMTQWLATRGSSKKTNTEPQKRAVYALFCGFWENMPIRDVTGPDAARFHDALKLFLPDWARSPASRNLPWHELLERFGGHPTGLAAQTMNRHIRNLQSLWDFAKKRGYCEGDNPFIGFSRKTKIGLNVSTYLPWEDSELDQIYRCPPRRQDLREVILVAMFSGMRLDEIASMTWAQVKTQGGIYFFDVIDPKTVAGLRHVPIHSKLAWLIKRIGKPADRIWPRFNNEGTSKKAGADASKLFSDYKIKLGFTNRQKTFHSFRKNVTRIMEHAAVPENAWAQVVGHEAGFTYGTYNPGGLTLGKKAEIIEKITYGNLPDWMPA